MKVRLRLLHPERRTVVANISDEEPVTLSRLAGEVTVLFNLAVEDFQLSLNGADILEEDGGTLLSDLGIVSGDLVHVLTKPRTPNHAGHNPVPTGPSPVMTDSTTCQQCDKDSSKPTSSQLDRERPPSDKDKMDCEQSKNSGVPQASNASNPDTGGHSSNAAAAAADDDDALMEDENAIQDAEVNRYLREPMMVRDSTECSVPQTLQQVYSSTSIPTQYEALVIVLHVLMTESGFLCMENDAVRECKCGQLPESWRDGGASVMLHYVHSGCPGARFSLAAVPLHSLLLVHGAIKSDDGSQKFQMKCKPAEYINNLPADNAASAYKHLGKLSREFKDSISYPLLKGAQSDEAASQVPSLPSLVYEVKMLMLECLDARSLLSLARTCKELQTVCKDPFLWRRLYLRKYGRRSATNELSQDWINLYKEKHQQRIQMREQMRRMTAIVPPFVDRPYPPLPLTSQPPFFIGGDYDRNPGFPDPFGQGAFAGPRIPRPRFDPVGPLPGGPFRPGRGGGLWDGRSGRGSRTGFGGFGPRMF